MSLTYSLSRKPTSCKWIGERRNGQWSFNSPSDYFLKCLFLQLAVNYQTLWSRTHTKAFLRSKLDSLRERKLRWETWKSQFFRYCSRFISSHSSVSGDNFSSLKNLMFTISSLEFNKILAVRNLKKQTKAKNDNFRRFVITNFQLWLKSIELNPTWKQSLSAPEQRI